MKRAVALCAFFSLAIAVPSASAAQFEIVPGSLSIEALDAGGQPETRAGSHPDRLLVDFGLNAEGTTARDFEFELPPGFTGSPAAVPPCPRALFEKGEEECPAESQVGTISLEFSGGGEATLPIFQIEPEPDEPFALGSIPGFDIPLAMELRPDDFGITFRASDIPEIPVSGGHVELWGVPADRQTGTSIPRLPFLALPTRCGRLAIAFRTRSWLPGAPWLSASAETDAPLTGCEALAFAPELELELDNPVADSPTGAQMAITLPDDDDPDGTVSAFVESATIALPDGVTVSPGGADGLTVCTDAELGLGDGSSASCPPSSRVGSVEVASIELREPLRGDVYLGEERPGERFRMFIVAPGPGVVVKAVSVLQIDPATGRLSAVLEDLPQVPISRLALRFDGGPQALLASPLACGPAAATGVFEPYGGGPPVDAEVSVQIGPIGGGSGCPPAPPFAPQLSIDSSSHAAGAPTTFAMTVLRRPGEQLTRKFSVSLPAGLSAALGEFDSCPDSAAASGACPAGSRLGGVLAKVGSGSDPATLAGDVYVAGPYRRAPFSLVMAFRAAIGPFDLGTTTVRAAMRIEPRSGRVTVLSDALPTLVEGVSIRFQEIGMVFDRPGAIRNPTSCRPARLEASFEAAGGASASASSELAIRGCKRLGLDPRFSLSLVGPSQLREHGRPGMRLFARFRRGDANLRALRLTLPSSLGFDLAGLREICPAQDAIDNLCSARARVGTTSARTSLLRKPLKGSIYVVQPEGGGLPDLWLSLAFNGVHLNVQGKASRRKGRFATNLVGLPDIPISSLTMHLRGGKRGALELGANPCADGRLRGLVSGLAIAGHNGARRELRLSARGRCGKTAG